MCSADGMALGLTDSTTQAAEPEASASAVEAAAAAPASQQPKQTLQEMAVWLDAQLAAAPGKQQFLAP